MPDKTDANIFVDIRREKLHLDEVFEFIQHDEAGALNVFTGTTRNHHDGKKVTELFYDCYEEMAKKEMMSIARKMYDRYALKKIYFVHRVGLVAVGDASIMLGISAAHRKEVFKATADTMNILKERVPIWKRETYEDRSVWKEELLLEKEQNIQKN